MQDDKEHRFIRVLGMGHSHRKKAMTCWGYDKDEENIQFVVKEGTYTYLLSKAHN